MTSPAPAPQSDPDRTARAITGRADEAVRSPTLSLRQGQITAVDTPGGKVDVTLGGDTASPIPGVRHLSNYRPVVNDTVWCLVQGPDLMVLDRPAQSFDGPGKHEWFNLPSGQVPAGPVSASYTTISSWSQTVNANIVTRGGTSNQGFVLNRPGWWSIVLQLETDCGMAGLMAVFVDWPSGAFANDKLVSVQPRWPPGLGFPGCGLLEQVVSWSGYVSPTQCLQPLYTKVRWATEDESSDADLRHRSLQLDYFGGGIA